MGVLLVLLPVVFQPVLFQENHLFVVSGCRTCVHIRLRANVHLCSCPKMLHVWYIYLQNSVIYGVNVGPAPWFAYGCVSSPRLRRCKRKKQITTRCGAVVPVPPASGRQKAFVSWVSFFQFTTVFPGISPEFNFVIFYKYIFFVRNLATQLHNYGSTVCFQVFYLPELNITT